MFAVTEPGASTKRDPWPLRIRRLTEQAIRGFAPQTRPESNSNLEPNSIVFTGRVAVQLLYATSVLQRSKSCKVIVNSHSSGERTEIV